MEFKVYQGDWWEGSSIRNFSAFCCECDTSTVVPMLVTEEGRNILRSVAGSARPYPRNSGVIATEARITPPEPETLRSADPFEELLSYTRKK